MENRPVVLDSSPLSVEGVVEVARSGRSVSVPEDTERLLDRTRQSLEQIAADSLPHYGVNTGFGSLARHRIGDEDLARLQVNLVRSHAAGVGDPLPTEVVRGTMLLLAASLCRGASGVSVELVRLLVSMLNAGITPVVPEIGSVGASGDLAPLAHIARCLIGEGDCTVDSGRVPSKEAFRSAGLVPHELVSKEGLALINGTHLMAARACLTLHDTERLLRAALVAGAMSVDGCRGSVGPFDGRIAELRGHPGVGVASRELRSLLEGSEIGPSHRDNDPRVQDPYSLRCQPQVVGAAIDQLQFVRIAVERELRAVTDNPLLVPGNELVSGGNFHGMPIALPLDILAVPIAHIAGLSERRVFWMLAAIDRETGLSPYLASQPGVSSGLMIAQYTAAAACNEIVGLAAPASTANLSTCAGVEDYNSFGPRSAAKATRSVALAESVIAIELLCASQALEFHRPLRSGYKIERARALVRERVPAFDADRSPGSDIEAVTDLIRRRAFDSLVSLERVSR